MRIAFGADEWSNLTRCLEEDLRRRGHQVEVVRASDGTPLPWPDVAQGVAKEVATGLADQGVLLCWTGTGVSMAANKVPGVRAALCADAETARGARRWNDANVLCMSLRLTSETVAREVLDAWFATSGPDPSEASNIQKLAELDQERARSSFTTETQSSETKIDQL